MVQYVSIGQSLHSAKCVDRRQDRLSYSGGMEARIDYTKVLPKDALHALYGLESAIRKSGLELSLLELVRMRASQINGCAYCLDMHSKDARANGETEQRLYALNAWRRRM